MKTLGVLLTGVSLLAGCGGVGSTGNTEAAKEANVAAPGPNTSVNSTNLAGPAEPPNCAGAAPSDSGPDVLNVRLGMAAEDVFSALKCANPAFNVVYSTDSTFQLPPMPDGSLPRTVVNATAAQDVATIYLMGLTGREKAIVLMHDITFPQEQAPSVEALLASLRSKYGPAETIAGRGNGIVRSIARAPGGNAFAANGADFRRCTQALGWNSEADFAAQDGCGLTINYTIDRRADDPTKAQKLYVVIADQAGAMRATQQAQRDIVNLGRGGQAGTPAPTQPGGPVPKL